MVDRRKFIAAGLGVGALAAAAGPTVLAPSASAAPVPALGFLTLDSFGTGSTDSRLTAALDTLRRDYPADGKPAIMMPAGVSGPYAVGRMPEKGVRLWFPAIATDQPKGNNPYPCCVKIAGTGYWWDAKDTVVEDFSMENFNINGQLGKTSVLGNGPKGGYRVSVFHNISAANHRTVLGDPNQQALFTACTFSGFSNWNNCSDTIYTIGGSDNFFFSAGNVFLDSPADMMKGKWIARIAYLSKSQVANHYITAENDVGGIRLTGNDAVSGTTLTGIVAEGRNRNAPSLGALIEQDGGDYGYMGLVTNFGDSVPDNDDRAIFELIKGQATLTQHVYDKGAQPETTPLYYVYGGELNTAQVRRAGGGWSGRPRYVNAGGAVFADGSVQAA